MKKILSLMLLATIVSIAAFSQDKKDYIKRPALGIHFFFSDFQTASRIRSSSLSSVLNNNQWSKFKDMNPGLAINYMEGLTPHLDFSATLGGSFVDYPIDSKPPFGSEKFLLEGTAMVHAKLLTDKYVLNPYLAGGIGISKYTGYYGAFMPLGLGLQVSVMDEAFLFINQQYRVKVSNNTNYHLYSSIGFAGNIGKPREKKKVIPPPPPPVVEQPKDSDADGIVDSADACPTEPGTNALNGCPDRDKDGIADKDDKCVDIPGTARYQGCPIPDTDADGVNDEEDKCKDVAGVARYQGCPVPDRDTDGVNDEEDKCPDVAGPAENEGCPKLESYNFNAANVQFKTGSVVLLGTATRELDKAVTILNEHPQLKISIEGHTDNTGNSAVNQKLSEKRAAAVKVYLVKKGIAADRLTVAGFGASLPIADNKTAKGRAANRRVEFKTGQ